MDQSAYLSRIGYEGPLEPTSAVLHALQRAHLYSVPFENLDIGLGRTIRLDEEILFDKIVRRRRGGFCYELNGLFARLLERTGYQVALLSAASANDDGSFSAEFEHLALEVRSVDEPGIPWLVDVGWGDGFVYPLNLLETGEQRQGGRVFRLFPAADHHPGARIMQELTSEGKWLTHYRFSPPPHAFEEFFPMCHYMQTSPDSMFTQKRLCTLYTPAGRMTLSDQTLITTTDTGGLRGSGIREERELANEEEARQVLLNLFGITL